MFAQDRQLATTPMESIIPSSTRSRAPMSKQSGRFLGAKIGRQSVT